MFLEWNCINKPRFTFTNNEFLLKMSEPLILSNRDAVVHSVEDILNEEQFPISELIINGIVTLIELISDYHEEGHKLLPEILIIRSKDTLEALTGRKVLIYTGMLSEQQFPRILKLCAPLAINNWHIYLIILDENTIEFGLISTEIRETSLSLIRNSIAMAEDDDHEIYIRNVGGKNVELITKDKEIIVALSLDQHSISTQDDNINHLVDVIISDCGNKSEVLFEFIKKIIIEALNEGHGNLIAVCKEDNLDQCLMSMTGGAVISPSIDIPHLLEDDENEDRSETSVAIKSFASLVKSMINHDGITIFSTKGKLIAFHYIVDNSKVDNTESVGGSRTKAFESLKNIKSLSGRFFKSQDGITKFA